MKKKDEITTTYQIRLPAALLAEFQAAAKVKDRSPAGEIRAYMREYVGQTDDDDLDDD